MHMEAQLVYSLEKVRARVRARLHARVCVAIVCVCSCTRARVWVWCVVCVFEFCVFVEHARKQFPCARPSVPPLLMLAPSPHAAERQQPGEPIQAR